jgi:hypothetical protein
MTFQKYWTLSILLSIIIPLAIIIPVVVQRSIANPATGQKTLDKEIKNETKDLKKEEKDLTKEAKKTCEVSFSATHGKSNKCEASIYDQALPNIDTDSVSSEIVDDIIRELQKEPKAKDSVIVR